MSSPFVLPWAALVAALLAGVVLGALGVLLAGLAARRAGQRALIYQADASAAELAGRAQELAALRAEHAALGRDRDILRDDREQSRVAHARVEAEVQGLHRRQQELEEGSSHLAGECRAIQHDLGLAQVALREAITQLAAERESHEQVLHLERTSADGRLAAERQAAEARLAVERCAADEKLLLLANARVELAHQFKALAGEIFDERSKQFGEQNTASMDTLLAPLKEKLGEFQQRVEGFSNESRVGRGELRTHIETLSKLNDRLSAEASSLASALKGSSKKQGDWGEVLLERMLEDSGLREGQEYRIQASFNRDDGTRARPDVILNLPGEKHLVIDAKVSLVDYNAYCDCSDDTSRAVSLARHVGSLREHIRGLSKRKYQALYELQSIDFVVMFVPIEPAYLLALSKDGRLWQEAWENDVLLVSPGTLFPVIRTVAHLWRQEQQNRNVQEIVYRGGELYDKLAAFAGDVMKIGDGLDTARTSYDKAMNKLKTGKGNAIRQAELLKGLGIKPSKQMPKELLESLHEELAHALVEETGAVAADEIGPLD